jgi:hypothetical protein
LKALVIAGQGSLQSSARFSSLGLRRRQPLTLRIPRQTGTRIRAKPMLELILFFDPEKIAVPTWFIGVRFLTNLKVAT